MLVFWEIFAQHFLVLSVLFSCVFIATGCAWCVHPCWHENIQDVQRPYRFCCCVCGGEESIVLYRLWHTTTLFEWSVSLWFQTNSNCAVFVNPNWIPEIFPAASYRHEWPNSLLVHQRRIWALLLNHADTRISHKQIDWQSFTQCSSMKTII